MGQSASLPQRKDPGPTDILNDKKINDANRLRRRRSTDGLTTPMGGVKRTRGFRRLTNSVSSALSSLRGQRDFGNPNHIAELSESKLTVAGPSNAQDEEFAIDERDEPIETTPEGPDLTEHHPGLIRAQSSSRVIREDVDDLAGNGGSETSSQIDETYVSAPSSPVPSREGHRSNRAYHWQPAVATQSQERSSNNGSPSTPPARSLPWEPESSNSARNEREEETTSTESPTQEERREVVMITRVLLAAATLTATLLGDVHLSLGELHGQSRRTQEGEASPSFATFLDQLGRGNYADELNTAMFSHGHPETGVQPHFFRLFRFPADGSGQIPLLLVGLRGAEASSSSEPSTSEPATARANDNMSQDNADSNSELSQLQDELSLRIRETDLGMQQHSHEHDTQRTRGPPSNGVGISEGSEEGIFGEEMRGPYDFGSSSGLWLDDDSLPREMRMSWGDQEMEPEADFDDDDAAWGPEPAYLQADNGLNFDSTYNRSPLRESFEEQTVSGNHEETEDEESNLDRMWRVLRPPQENNTESLQNLLDWGPERRPRESREDEHAVWPSAPPAHSSRRNRHTWVVYVIGGHYEASHPIFEASEHIDDDPAFQDLRIFEQLLRPTKPKTLRRSELDKAGRTSELTAESELVAAGESCPVCLSDYAESDQVRELVCKHTFHTHCVDTWLLKQHGTCPLCRKSPV